MYGLAFLGRHSMRQQLQQAQAVRFGNANEEPFREWQADVNRMTEVPRV